MRSEISRSDFVIGNAPTALLALCTELPAASVSPSGIGAPVGFISVLESKAALAQTQVNQIRLEGRKVVHQQLSECRSLVEEREEGS